jgi:hypothetical protein
VVLSRVALVNVCHVTLLPQPHFMTIDRPEQQWPIFGHIMQCRQVSLQFPHQSLLLPSSYHQYLDFSFVTRLSSLAHCIRETEDLNSTLPVCLEITRRDIRKNIRNIVLVSQALELLKPTVFFKYAWRWFKTRQVQGTPSFFFAAII